jgi:hypothetical protein
MLSQEVLLCASQNVEQQQLLKAHLRVAKVFCHQVLQSPIYGSFSKVTLASQTIKTTGIYSFVDQKTFDWQGDFKILQANRGTTDHVCMYIEDVRFKLK